MSYNHAKFIKELRIKRGLSQEEVARKIGIGRNKYLKFEQGEAELKFSEMVRLTEYFGISLEAVENGINADYEKYKEMILECLRFAGSGDGKIPKTKLAKLVYLVDFAWFYEKLESMSGMAYRRLHYGPVPEVYFRALDELEESGKIIVDRTKDCMLLIKESESNIKQELRLLNKEERMLIRAINQKWQNKKTEEIVNFTHNQMPYFLCRDNEIIPYELITQENPDNIY